MATGGNKEALEQQALEQVRQLRALPHEEDAATAYAATIDAAARAAGAAQRDLDAEVCRRIADQAPEHAPALHRAAEAIRAGAPSTTPTLPEER